ncbi:MAG: hypothetical protein ACOYM9_22325 [Bradymonadia bacterium]
MHTAIARRGLVPRLFLLCLAPTACSDAESSADTPCAPVGGPGAAPAIVEVLENDGRGALSVVAPDGPVNLRPPFQGGHVLFVGARVTGLCPTNLVVSGRIVDPASGEVVSVDNRTGVTLVEREDGTMAPDPQDLSAVANIALCPETTGLRDIEGTTLTLELRVSDAQGRRAETTRTVVPTCGGLVDVTDRESCTCECKRGGGATACP